MPYFTNFPVDIIIDKIQAGAMVVYVTSKDCKIAINCNAIKPFYIKHQFIANIFVDNVIDNILIESGRWFRAGIKIIEKPSSKSMILSQRFDGNYKFLSEDRLMVATLEATSLIKRMTWTISTVTAQSFCIEQNVSSNLSNANRMKKIFQVNGIAGSTLDVRYILGFVVLNVFEKELNIYDTMS